MKAGQIKGALLEYAVREILKSCGFINCIADNTYIFENHGLLYINGKGAAHDADILMDPPIQMPFSLPSRLLFECKAYNTKSPISLPIVRNALGLRRDINEFEIVTKKSLQARKNNRRSSYAIENRQRYYYQVGVASVNDFTKPAYEFAANNKIPLFSLSWFLNGLPLNKFNSISQADIDKAPKEVIKNIYTFLKDRNGHIEDEKYEPALLYFRSDTKLGDIKVSLDVRNKLMVYVGVIETGDLIFLYPANKQTVENFKYETNIGNYRARIHYNPDKPNLWTLSTIEDGREYQFNFFLPELILKHWTDFNLDKVKALDIKGEFFSRVFLFNKNLNPENPFKIFTIDNDWLDQLRMQYREDE